MPGRWNPPKRKKGPKALFFNDLQASLWIYIWSGKRDIY